MTIGSDTFIHRILSEIGFENIFKDKTRYPQITTEDLVEADVIMLSSEPFPFKEKHIEELQVFYPDKKIMIVDGEAFSGMEPILPNVRIILKNFSQKFIQCSKVSFSPHLYTLNIKL